jgi:hypothetical protein
MEGIIVKVAFRDLCPHLGHVARVHIDVRRSSKKEPGRITVHWRCGCLAAGETLRALALEPCGTHAEAASRAPARA